MVLETRTVPLVEMLPGAEVRQETGRLDIGSGAADAAQIEGWSWNERQPSGLTFSWGLAPQSRLRFFLLQRKFFFYFGELLLKGC